MLTELSGKTHSVITAVVLMIPAGGSSHLTIPFSEETFVKFSELSPQVIEAYVETGTPMFVEICKAVFGLLLPLEFL